VLQLDAKEPILWRQRLCALLLNLGMITQQQTRLVPFNPHPSSGRRSEVLCPAATARLRLLSSYSRSRQAAPARRPCRPSRKYPRLDRPRRHQPHQSGGSQVLVLRTRHRPRCLWKGTSTLRAAAITTYSTNWRAAMSRRALQTRVSA
jgi:hypothetical protein